MNSNELFGHTRIDSTATAIFNDHLCTDADRIQLAEAPRFVTEVYLRSVLLPAGVPAAFVAQLLHDKCKAWNRSRKLAATDTEERPTMRVPGPNDIHEVPTAKFAALPENDNDRPTLVQDLRPLAKAVA